jgi:hypothetical protein
MQYIHLSPLADVPLHLLIAGQLSGKKPPWVPSQGIELPYSKPTPTHYHLSYVAPTAITICNGLSHPTGWAALLSENISRRFFFKGGETF